MHGTTSLKRWRFSMHNVGKSSLGWGEKNTFFSSTFDTGSTGFQSLASEYKLAVPFFVLYAFFWVILRLLNLKCRRFGTLRLFHLHRRVGTYLPAYNIQNSAKVWNQEPFFTFWSNATFKTQNLEFGYCVIANCTHGDKSYVSEEMLPFPHTVKYLYPLSIFLHILALVFQR